MPNTPIRIATFGHVDVVFNPKIYIFDGPAGWATLIDSGNVTNVGLLRNAQGPLLVSESTRSRTALRPPANSNGIVPPRSIIFVMSRS